MNIKDFPNEIKWFLENGVPIPDEIFFAETLNSDAKKELAQNGLICSLTESRKNNNNQYLTGCYCFFNNANDKECIYVGKAAKLRNRVSTHWNKPSEIIIKWNNDICDKWNNGCDYDFIPFVAIWFSDERASLEALLMEKLKPLYNKRKEQ